MASSTAFKHSLLLRVGVVAEGSRCLSIMRMLDSVHPHGLHLKLMGMVPVSNDIAFNKYAGEMGVAIYNDSIELLSNEPLDLILDLSSDPQIQAQLQKHKPESVGVLDRQASMLLFDIAHQYERVRERDSEISLATSFASTLLEASPDGVMVIDRNFRIIDAITNDTETDDFFIVVTSKSKSYVAGKSIGVNLIAALAKTILEEEGGLATINRMQLAIFKAKELAKQMIMEKARGLH